MPQDTFEAIAFPPDFAFGVADCDLQTIGTQNTISLEKSEPTEWDSFVDGYHADTPKVGIDRYHKWKEDAQLMHSFGIKIYRTSISMSRVLQENGEVNAAAIQWYKNYFTELRRLGITIYATLYHWELPEYLAKVGGWANPKTSEIFLKHTQTVYQELGEYIEEYFIFNEPWVIAMLGYYIGINPPQQKSLAKALLVAHHILMTQASAFELLKRFDPSLKVSTVLNVETAYPKEDTEHDRKAASIYDGYFNRWFLDPIFKGEYPPDMVELYGKNMPTISLADMKHIQIGSRLHALGINYYRGVVVHANTDSGVPIWQDEKELHFLRSEIAQGAMLDGMGRALYLPPFYKPGLYDFLTNVYAQYKDHGMQRIYITENGLPLNTPWDKVSAVIDDEKRIEVLSHHLLMIQKAIKEGVPVSAYFHWTLMDNFEWGGGYDPNNCYGLVHVDRETLKRIPKKSLYWYSDQNLVFYSFPIWSLK